MTAITGSKWAGVEGRGKLVALARMMTAIAKTALETSGEIAPVVAVGMASGEVGLVVVEWRDGDKRATYAALAKMARDKLHMEAAVLVNDAWIAKLPKTTDPALFEGSVRDVPGHVEALVVTVLGPDLRESRCTPYERVAGKIKWHDETVSTEFENALFSLTDEGSDACSIG